MNLDPDASKIWLRNRKTVYDDDRVTKNEIFFDYFEGEEWIIKKRRVYNFLNESQPIGCIVWRKVYTII